MRLTLLVHMLDVQYPTRAVGSPLLDQSIPKSRHTTQCARNVLIQTYELSHFILHTKQDAQLPQQAFVAPVLEIPICTAVFATPRYTHAHSR